MKNFFKKLLYKFAGIPLVDPIFLMRMRSIEKQMHYAIKEYSFVILSAAEDRIIREYDFKHSKIELDLILEIYLKHNSCRKQIEDNLKKEAAL